MSALPTYRHRHRDYIHCLEGDVLPENLLRPALRLVLIALDYLHQAKVIHTGKGYLDDQVPWILLTRSRCSAKQYPFGH